MELVVLIGEWHVPSCFCNKCQMLEIERTAASKVLLITVFVSALIDALTLRLLAMLLGTEFFTLF